MIGEKSDSKSRTREKTLRKLGRRRRRRKS